MKRGQDEGKYNGLSKSAVMGLIDRTQKAEAKKRHVIHSPDEKAAMDVYYEERLGNPDTMELRDWLGYYEDAALEEESAKRSKDSPPGKCNCDDCRAKREGEWRPHGIINGVPTRVAEIDEWRVSLPVETMPAEELDRLPTPIFCQRDKRSSKGKNTTPAECPVEGEFEWS